MDIITKDNKQYIPARIVMLPTKISTIHLSEFGTILESVSETGKNALYRMIPQHLYLICDLPIEEGDYGIDIRDNKIFKCDRILTNHYESGVLSFQKSYCKKVIVTTDTNFKIKQKYDTHISIKSLPQFQQSFIKEFVERQGKDVDVLVEVESFVDLTKMKDDNLDKLPSTRVKLNPNNTINLIFK